MFGIYFIVKCVICVLILDSLFLKIDVFADCDFKLLLKEIDGFDNFRHIKNEKNQCEKGFNVVNDLVEYFRNCNVNDSRVNKEMSKKMKPHHTFFDDQCTQEAMKNYNVKMSLRMARYACTLKMRVSDIATVISANDDEDYRPPYLRQWQIEAREACCPKRRNFFDCIFDRLVNQTNEAIENSLYKERGDKCKRIKCGTTKVKLNQLLYFLFLLLNVYLIL